MQTEQHGPGLAPASAQEPEQGRQFRVHPCVFVETGVGDKIPEALLPLSPQVSAF